ncbi:MAG: MBL fold metallo-hydrolase [Treponema sp.]|jgi:glyoxylase-like metal-dependent hydrolase (beta-lactamase superfamily II)|nr:MBL fold metallo-hydrolase [Treponema sp.]
MPVYQIVRLVVGDFRVNCWIVFSEGSGSSAPYCGVIDPGEDADLIVARLKTISLRPSHILLTHGHFDHSAALPDLRAAYPEASIAIHRADAPYLGPASLDLHRRSFSAAAGDSSYVDARWKAMPAADRELEEGDRIGPFTVLSLPGHSPGSAAFVLGDQNVIFSGDTLFRGNCGRVDLPGGDRREIEKSLKRLLALEGEIRVLPGHGEATTVAAERGTRFF